MMQRTVILALGFVAFFAGAAGAQEIAANRAETATTEVAALSVVERWREDPTIVFDAAEVVMADLLYVARPLIVFADSPAQPQFAEQLRLLAAHPAELARRDVIVIADADPAARSDARRTLRPRGFSLVLVDKDGRIGFRKPEPWAVREIVRQIDKMPSRIREVREGLGQAD
jgi:hypothetical protein